METSDTKALKLVESPSTGVAIPNHGVSVQKCRIKTYMIGLSTKFYFITIAFVWALLHIRNNKLKGCEILEMSWAHGSVSSQSLHHPPDTKARLSNAE